MRICKVVRRKYTNVANSYGYNIWVYRVIECEDHQSGYLSEKNVELIWESEPITYYSPKLTTKCGKNLVEARRISDYGNKCLSLGLTKKVKSHLLDTNIRGLAKEIYKTKNWLLMSILKDALQDANFPVEYIRYLDTLTIEDKICILSYLKDDNFYGESRS